MDEQTQPVEQWARLCAVEQFDDGQANAAMNHEDEADNAREAWIVTTAEIVQRRAVIHYKPIIDNLKAELEGRRESCVQFTKDNDLLRSDVAAREHLIDELRHELQQARRERDEAVETLREIEWLGSTMLAPGGEANTCPICHRIDPNMDDGGWNRGIVGHSDDCRIFKTLSRLSTQDKGE